MQPLLQQDSSPSSAWLLPLGLAVAAVGCPPQWDPLLQHSMHSTRIILLVECSLLQYHLITLVQINRRLLLQLALLLGGLVALLPGWRCCGSFRVRALEALLLDMEAPPSSHPLDLMCGCN